MNAAIDTVRTETSSYRWIILFFCWLAFLFDTICRLTWSSISTTVAGSIGLPIGALGTFVTAFLIGSVACNMLGGLSSDRFGGRIVIAISMICLGVSTFAFSLMASIPSGLTIQLLMGLSAGANYAACVKLIVTWFDPSKRGQAMGIFLMAISLGIVATNAIVPSLMAHIGWVGVYRLLGVATSILGIICFIILRDRQALATSPSAGSAPAPKLGDLATDRNLLLAAAGGFGGFWGTWGFTYWASALLIRGRGFTPVEAGTIVALVGSAGLVGKPLAGWLSDRLGGQRKWLIILFLVLLSVALTLFGFLETRISFQIAAPLLGIGAFCYSPLIVTLMAELSGPKLAGSVAGMATALWQVGGLIVPLVVGYVFQVTGSFVDVFAMLALGPLAGAVCMLCVKTPRRGLSL